MADKNLKPNEQEILKLVNDDPIMMSVIGIASSLNLPDWVIGAGFVRNKVWDHLHGLKSDCATNDIDLVYFDREKKFNDSDIESRLTTLDHRFKWEVVNQATAHLWNGARPYSSTTDALSKWTETATGIGVTLESGKLKLVAPCGIDDLVNLIIRPTSTFMATERGREYIRTRVEQKKWLKRWPKLQLEI